DVHTARGDDEILLPIGNDQEAVSVDRPDVPGVEPSVQIEDFARRLRLLEVPERGDVRPARQDLAVRGDPQLDARQGLADGAELEAIGPIEREGRTRLGEPVALQEE